MIYPNPADLSSDEDEPPPPPPPLQSYGGGSHYANVDDFPPPPQESSVPTATGIRVTMAPNRPYTATNPTYEVIDNYSAPVANTRNEPFNVPRSRSPYQERVTVERSVPSYNPKPASFSYATSSSRPVFGKVTSQAAQVRTGTGVRLHFKNSGRPQDLGFSNHHNFKSLVTLMAFQGMNS